MSQTLPFRPNVGIALFNREGLVIAGMALNEGPEKVVAGFEWQMPQGGIDPDEDIETAARRELLEETGIGAVSFLAATDTWWAYDFPPYAGPAHSLSGFRGQIQRWVALRFEGNDGDINVTAPESGLRPEFSAWSWMALGALPDQVMPHKRPTYRKVGEAFFRFTAEAGA
ncbi:RNA pyrophosphohydrolase [Lichenihabitans sp. Uapishka_5]|uniref:RNA pyrophosphohydrolase n=1 Tax=Lichenihabitans sp. Uapishka_5 TaxID=3037302 RepID=UPI0029E7DD41|nr:RNA pyrophosphohydrolase [Lichenihabitans sp. Uapishka_5]MDX7951949.1 RNA pyrophosphohydrolase [Lichenihabitans sp. Uapishka_5]